MQYIQPVLWEPTSIIVDSNEMDRDGRWEIDLVSRNTTRVDEENYPRVTRGICPVECTEVTNAVLMD